MFTNIKTFEDACKKIGVDLEKALPDVSMYRERHQKAITSLAKLFIISDAINGAWEPDWQDNGQYKYYPWFDMEKDENNPTGFRLYTVVYGIANSDLGSRLCFENREKAKYVAEQFIDLYRDFMVF